MKRGITSVMLLVASIFASPAVGVAADSKLQVPDVSANMVLSALVALSDNYIQEAADTLKIFAMSDAAQSGDWQKIREPLQEVTKLNIEAAWWFALPNGEYWTVQNGRAAGNLSDRPYFPRVLKGNTVLGDLVVSRSTGKSVAIVAVPILGKDGNVVGALGTSIYLDKLSERLRRDLDVSEGMIYYSFDSQPLVGINWDPTLIFADPRQLGPEVSQAFEDMLKKNEGTESYVFRGKKRTVSFRRSDVTGWWYAFGVVSNAR